MGLPVPTVGQEAGPQWATDINNSLNIIDAHTHSTGSGAPITPSAININTDLSFQGFSATQLVKTVFISQSAALTGTQFCSVVGGNLYFNDGSGNQIPITAAGGVAGSPGSIGSLVSPASATYSSGSKTFTWAADSGKAAAMDNGAVTIRETNVASANGITIASPSALAAGYQFTLPGALPVSTQYLTSSSSGVLSFSTSNQIAAAATRATGTTVGTGGVAISTASVAASFTNTVAADVTNLTITITTSGRPVYVGIVSGETTTGMDFLVFNNTGNGAATGFAILKILRGGSDIASYQVNYSYTQSGVGVNAGISMFFIDAVAAGTYTYKVQELVGASTTTLTLSALKLIAYEL